MQTNSAGINILTKSQAIGIRRSMQSKSYGQALPPMTKPSWTQVVRVPQSDGKGMILEENFEGSRKSPIELMKLYPEGYQVWLRKEKTGTAVTVSTEDPAIAFYRNAAHKETIMALLARLAMLKPFAGSEVERAYKLRDYALRLVHYKVKEIDLFDAVEEIVDNDMNDFFPSYAKLHRRIFGTSEAKTYE